MEDELRDSGHQWRKYTLAGFRCVKNRTAKNGIKLLARLNVEIAPEKHPRLTLLLV
jgi:hypothetical protein